MNEPVPIPAKVVRAAFLRLANIVRIVLFGQSAPKRVIAVALGEVLAFFLHDDLHQLVALVPGQIHPAAPGFIKAAGAVAPAVVLVVDLRSFTVRVFAVLVVPHSVACPFLRGLRVGTVAVCVLALQCVVLAVLHLLRAYWAGFVLGPLLCAESVGLVQLAGDDIADCWDCGGGGDRQAVACRVKPPALLAGVRGVRAGQAPCRIVGEAAHAHGGLDAYHLAQAVVVRA